MDDITTDNYQQDEAALKQRKRRKAITITLLCILVIAAIGIICTFVLKMQNVDEKVGNFSVYTDDMILPNATLNIDYYSNTTIAGDIGFYEFDIIPYYSKFNWESFQNDSYAFIRFTLSNGPEYINLKQQILLNGYSGFEINTNDLNKPDNQSNGILNLLVYKIHEETPFLITLSPDNEELSGILEKETLEKLMCGHIGEYFVELSIKLGSLKYIGQNNIAVSTIHQYARLLYSMVHKDPNENNWEWNKIDNAIQLTNALLHASIKMKYNNEFGFTSSKIDKDTIDTTRDSVEYVYDNVTFQDDKRRLQLSGCTAPWYYIGDGYCDEEANNAACNWDNGDCCEATCKSAHSWEDHNGVDYNGYECGINGYNCLPECNVEYADWLGDGFCDTDGGYNTEQCGYDNGDCCPDSCTNAAYTCGSNGYQCYDSSDNFCSREACDNPCVGLCGADCSCWTWTCGDCKCHGECAEHDMYCSCISDFTFWCLNVFWVDCDDGSLAVF